MTAIDDLIARFDPFPILPATRVVPSENDLREFEREIGAALPSDYREALMSHGRMGFGREARFRIREPSPWGGFSSIAELFGFSQRQNESIVYRNKVTYARRIPRGTIAIAADPGGNLLILGLEGATRPGVWFWDHEFRDMAERLDDIVGDLQAQGIDVGGLDEEALIRHWEDRFPERLNKPPRWSNVYAVADSFTGLLEGLYPG
jgi:hypothetical protein